MAREIKHYAKFLFYPWSFWWLSAWYPRVLRRRYAEKSRGAVLFAWGLQALSYLLVGFPVTIYVTGELLISLNEAVIGEHANYRLQSDFEAGLTDVVLELPGPHSPDPAPVAYAQTDEYRRYLVEKYAPVIVQKVWRKPLWDIPVFLEFDGNFDPRDNVVNGEKFMPHHGGVYGELTAETADSFYLAYSLYHIRDYDHPIREITRYSYHDNDNEGFVIRVDKQTMQVADASTWFHNRFLLFNNTGVSTGSEPVHGKLRMEGGTHFIAYAQPMGHGIRGVQVTDLKDLGVSTKILRYRGNRPEVVTRADRELQVDATYDLRDFREWYARALGPFGKGGQGPELFEETIRIGEYADGTPMVIGRFFGGLDYAAGSWARPKPMWSWDDGWDEMPTLLWHFAPSYVLASHSGQELSNEYLYNEPVSRVFGMTTDEFLAHATRLPSADRSGQEKWGRVDLKNAEVRRKMDISSDYWAAFEILLKRYVNYLFRALG